MKRQALPAFARLATGIAASGLVANAANMFESQRIIASIGSRVAAVMLANGVTDGAIAWQSEAGWTHRTAHLSGTADAATRTRIVAALANEPGLHAADWRPR